MAPDKSTDTLVLLEAYLETAMALVGLARMAPQGDGFDAVMANVRRNYETAGKILQQITDSEAQRELGNKLAALSGMLDEVARSRR